MQTQSRFLQTKEKPNHAQIDLLNNPRSFVTEIFTLILHVYFLSRLERTKLSLWSFKFDNS